MGTTRFLRAARAVAAGIPAGPRNATNASTTARTTAVPIAQRQGSWNFESSVICFRTAGVRGSPPPPLRLPLIVEPRVVENFLSHEDAQGVGELQVLDEEV